MTPAEWNRLMRQARAHAMLHRHRVKVRAARLPPMAASAFGVQWAYAIDCPMRSRDFLRGH